MPDEIDLNDDEQAALDGAWDKLSAKWAKDKESLPVGDEKPPRDQAGKLRRLRDRHGKSKRGS